MTQVVPCLSKQNPPQDFKVTFLITNQILTKCYIQVRDIYLKTAANDNLQQNDDDNVKIAQMEILKDGGWWLFCGACTVVMAVVLMMNDHGLNDHGLDDHRTQTLIASGQVGLPFSLCPRCCSTY